MKNPTSIQISRTTKERLAGMKNHPGETFEQVLYRMYVSIKENDAELLTKEDILEIEQSIKEIKKGNYKTQAQMKEKYGLK